MRIAIVLFGEPASKSNSREIVSVNKRAPDGTLKRVPRSIKSDAARQFELDAIRQIPAACRLMLTCDVRVTMRLYYRTRRPDLDETVVLDVLQARYQRDKHTGQCHLVQRGVYVNDRQVREKHVYWGLDPANPRAEILIEPLIDESQLELVGDDELAKNLEETAF